MIGGMKQRVIDEILGDFDPEAGRKIPRVRDGEPVTIWLPADAKARYERLQKSSGQRLSKKLREVFIAVLDIAEARAS